MHRYSNGMKICCSNSSKNCGNVFSFDKNIICYTYTLHVMFGCENIQVALTAYNLLKFLL